MNQSTVKASVPKLYKRVEQLIGNEPSSKQG
jgi:hypothetical protein